MVKLQTRHLVLNQLHLTGLAFLCTFKNHLCNLPPKRLTTTEASLIGPPSDCLCISSIFSSYGIHAWRGWKTELSTSLLHSVTFPSCDKQIRTSALLKLNHEIEPWTFRWILSYQPNSSPTRIRRPWPGSYVSPQNGVNIIIYRRKVSD